MQAVKERKYQGMYSTTELLLILLIVLYSAECIGKYLLICSQLSCDLQRSSKKRRKGEVAASPFHFASTLKL